MKKVCVGEMADISRVRHLGLGVAFQKLALIGADFVGELFKDQLFLRCHPNLIIPPVMMPAGVLKSQTLGHVIILPNEKKSII